MPLIEASRLQESAIAILEAVGAPDEHARWVAEHLVESNLAGHDSHGVIRLPQYVAAVDQGQVNPIAIPRCVQEHLTCATFDGQNGFGQVAINSVLEWAIARATRYGISTVTLSDCYHSGRLGAYTSSIAQRGFVSIMLVNAGGGGQWVAPFGGRAARLSTNPMSIAAPSPGEFPLVLDIATSVAPEGKVRRLLQQGERVPFGWAIDSQGNPTDDPHNVYNSPPGALLPLGGEVGYKGFGLAFMIDVFAGALSGAGCCTAENVTPRDGIFLLVANPKCFGSGGDYLAQVGALVGHIKSCPTMPGFEEVYVPGELEYRTAAERRQTGIPLSNETWHEIKQISERLGIDHSLQLDASS